MAGEVMHAIWCWEEGAATVQQFAAADASQLEAAYLKQLFWGQDNPNSNDSPLALSDFEIDIQAMAGRKLFGAQGRVALSRSPALVPSGGSVPSRSGGMKITYCAAEVGSLLAPPALSHACLNGDARVARGLLFEFGDFASALLDAESQATGVHALLLPCRLFLCCCSLGQALTVRFLLAVLHVAASQGHLDVVKCLVASGAALSSQTRQGANPLHAAASYNCQSVVEFLVRMGATVDSRTSQEATPLFLAAQAGSVEAVRFLLERGADANAAAANGATPLIVAAEGGHTSVIETLVSAGADLDRADTEGVTALMIASHFGRMDVVEYLLNVVGDQRKFDPDVASTAGATPLFMAAQNGHASVVRLLAQTGSKLDVSFKDPAGDEWDAHEAALINGYENLAEALEAWAATPALIRLTGTRVKRGQRYRVSKRAVVRESYDMVSKQVSSLNAGDVVVALDGRQISTSTKESGEGVMQTRVRFENGWVSLNARDGTPLLVLLDDNQNGASPWQKLQASVTSTNSLPSGDDIFASLGAFGFTDEAQSVEPRRRFRRQTEAVMPAFSNDRRLSGDSSSLPSFAEIPRFGGNPAAAGSPAAGSPVVIGSPEVIGESPNLFPFPHWYHIW